MPYWKNYPHLFSPGKIGKLTIPNRVALAPFGSGHTGPDNSMCETLIQLYEERARGGVGMIISECTVVAPEIDPFPLIAGTLRLESYKKVRGLSEYVERMEALGAVPAIQLSLGMGRQADDPRNAQPISSSPVPTVKDPGVICRPLTVDEIHSLVASAGRAAGYAKTAGVKLIEIHGHSGYLMDQFFNPEINKRTDEYGGSIENRFRIAKETVEAIKAVVGDSIPVTLRIAVDHKYPGGRTLEEGLELCKLAEAAGYDGLHIDAGRHEVRYWIFPTPYQGQNCLVDLAAAVKNVVSIPVIAVGSIADPAEAEEAIASGKCDFVAMTRSLLADPEWAKKAREGRPEDIRHCLRCNEKCVGRATLGKPLSCAVNPVCGRESYNKVAKAEKAKKVTVIGGGPAGMVAALTALKRGHSVTLLERSAELGGLLNLAEDESFKHGMKGYNAYLKTQIAKSSIEVKFNTAADLDAVKATEPDAVVVATGGKLFIPGLPGFEMRADIGTVKEFKEKEHAKDEKIVIAGGGIIACETAIGLLREGYTDVSIVEMTDTIGGDLMFINRSAVMDELATWPIKIYTGTRCESVDGTTLICSSNGEKVELPFEYLLVAMGLKSENTLNTVMEDNFPEVYCVGSCINPGFVYNAVEEAYNAAKRI